MREAFKSLYPKLSKMLSVLMERLKTFLEDGCIWDRSMDVGGI